MASSHKDHTTIFIDSADRDQIAYANPASYNYNLPTTLRNIESIEIMSFQMMCTEGILTTGNTIISVVYNGVTTTLTLTYNQQPASITDLATILQTGLKTINSSFAVASSALTNRLTITASADFSIIVTEGFARVFGFNGKTTITNNNGTSMISNRGAGTLTSTNHVLVGTKSVELLGVPYILLFLNEYERNTGSSMLAQTSFMSIPLENNVQNSRFVIVNDEKEHKGRYYLDGDRIDSISVRLTRPDGTLYDFNGTDHQMVVKITHKDGRNYLS